MDFMDDKDFEIKKIVTALKGSAKGIAAAMDNDDISSDEVFCILTAIAERLGLTVSESVPG